MEAVKCKQEFLKILLGDNFSKGTVRYYDIYLKQFLVFLKETYKLTDVRKITVEMLKSYIDDVDEKKYTVSTVISKLICVKKFFAFLLDRNYIFQDFSHLFEYRRKEQKLYTNVLSENQIKKIFSLPDPGTYTGFRDLVIFEFLYNTGVRKSELLALEIYDLNFDEQTIFVRQGKGKKDRIVPMGKYLAQYLREYIGKVRPVLVRHSGTRQLFVNALGDKISPSSFYYLIRKYSDKAGFRFTCHTFRHSFATHMLKHGAGVLYISRILGHEEVSTTEIYTKVYPKELKRIIEEYHPRSSDRVLGEKIVLPEQGKRFNLPVKKVKKLKEIVDREEEKK